MWPGKKANVLRQNAGNKPHISWSKIPCTIKRRYIPTFEEAEQEAAELSGLSTESSDAAPKTKKKKTNQAKLSKNNIDLNHLIEGK